MARFYETALAELESLKAEFDALSTISDEEACYIYNVDSKAEIAEEMTKEIACLEREVESLTPQNWSDDPVIEIFGSYKSMSTFLY